MSLHIRRRGTDDPLTTPARDFAYIYPAMMKDVASRFDRGNWPAMLAVLEREGATGVELTAGLVCFVQFLDLAQEQPDKPMEDSLRQSGWLECKPVVQMGINAMLGAVMTGQMFVGLRDLALIDAPHQPQYRDALWHAREALRLVALPAWRRKLYFWWRALRGRADIS